MNYFGEKTNVDCGICSYCITQKRQEKQISVRFLKTLLLYYKSEDLNSREIQNRTKNSPDDVIFVLQQLLENNTILVKPNNKYTLKS